MQAQRRPTPRTRKGQNINRRRPKPKTRPSKPSRSRKVKRPKIKYVKDVKIRKIPFIVYLLAFFGFLLGIVTLIAGANVTLQRVLNSSLEADLISIVNLNNNLTIQLSGDHDIGYIEYLARTRLNMIDPAPHQIRHIEVKAPITPIVDLTRQPLYDEGIIYEVTGFLNRFWNFITGN